MPVAKSKGYGGKESAILVSVRVRPFNSQELALLNPSNAQTPIRPIYGGSLKPGEALRKIVHTVDENVLVFDPPPESQDENMGINRYRNALLNGDKAAQNAAFRRYKDVRYAFDRVFDETAGQEEVWEETTKDLIDGVLNGYNATVFAYGATGCGKTHTISGSPEDPGIIFLTIRELYERIEQLKDDKTIHFSLSYLEVYNEQIKDLLVENKKATLALRENDKNKIVVAGLSEHHPKNINEVMNLIFLGNANRTMSPTEANAVSSRSHAVLQINIRQRPRTADVQTDYTLATLSLIDLAGSERAAASRNRGDRMLEGANINRSLLALGNCINALCDVTKREQHIPYRDSKLTRLLKFSLGGNCKTVMIVCVSPSSLHYEETHNTLKYANRAKNIKTKVKQNLVSVDRHVTKYVDAISSLREEVKELKQKLKDAEENSMPSTSIARKSATQTRQLEEAINKMRTAYALYTSKETDIAGMRTRQNLTSQHMDWSKAWQAAFYPRLDKNTDEKTRAQVSGYGNSLAERLKNLEAQQASLRSNLDMLMRSNSVPRRDYGSRDDPLVRKERELLEAKVEAARLKSSNTLLERHLMDTFHLVQSMLAIDGEALAGLKNVIGQLKGADPSALDCASQLYNKCITFFTDFSKLSLDAKPPIFRPVRPALTKPVRPMVRKRVAIEDRADGAQRRKLDKHRAVTFAPEPTILGETRAQQVHRPVKGALKKHTDRRVMLEAT
ncbi:hypothetical protein BZG36_02322, partial [Bifiguratus adelaidae]